MTPASEGNLAATAQPKRVLGPPRAGRGRTQRCRALCSPLLALGRDPDHVAREAELLEAPDHEAEGSSACSQRRSPWAAERGKA